MNEYPCIGICPRSHSSGSSGSNRRVLCKVIQSIRGRLFLLYAAVMLVLSDAREVPPHLSAETRIPLSSSGSAPTHARSHDRSESSLGTSLLVRSPLVRSATDLLQENYRAELEATIPSPSIDEHQESTTSLMVAQAWAHVNQRRARTEILSIFRGQWANGMVPTVRFAPGYDANFLGGTFIPGPGRWGENASSRSAGGANTSSLAALPLHAEAALKIFNLSSRDADARLWLQGLFPSLFRYHDYLHKDRGDPETGLVYVYHPWETEVAADSTRWSPLLREARERAANESWSPPPVPEDVSSVPGFPGDDAFGSAVFLTECATRHGHVDKDVQRECPFLLQDVQFNAVLLRSDKALLELADILEATRSGWQSKVYSPQQYDRLEGWASRANRGLAMEHLWDPDEEAFLSRYISTVTSEVSPARPSTSSGLSALLAPGLPPSQANYAIDILLSPGSLSFRCGNHPAPELECGYNRNTTRGGRSDDVVRTFALEHEGGVKQSRDRDQAGSMAVRAAAEPEVAAAAATAATVKVAGGGEASVPGSVSGRDSSNAWGSMVFMTGDVDAEHGTAEDGGTWQRDHHLRRRQQEQESETWEGNKDLRVWVFHNFLAERGLSRQSLPGVSVWLANSTLSLMSATLTNEEIEVFLERDDANDNDNVRGVEALSGDQRGMETAVEFQSRTVRTVAKVGRHYDYGGEPTPWSKDDVDIENEVDRRKLITVGDNTDDDGEDEGGVFLFHRAFDGITGAPVPNAEANSSSLAAATSVMLLLGSGPEGGNEFPPITHATLFVLVAIELGFSFAVGVSCLVFSVNLVRKLREDDQPSYYLERDSSSGSAESTSIAGSASTRDGRVSSLPRENGASRLSSSKTRAHALAGASPEFGALSTADVARRRPSGRSRASLVARRRPQEDRGIGSLLTRKNRSSGSRLNVYDDSDEEEEETMTMTAGNRRSTRDRGWRRTGALEGDDDLEDDTESTDHDNTARWLDERLPRSSNQRKQSSDTERGGDGGSGGHLYRTLPADINNRGGNGSSAGVEARVSAKGAAPGDDGGLNAEGDSLGQQASGVSGASRHREEDTESAGMLDVLRPFYASLKFW